MTKHTIVLSLAALGAAALAGASPQMPTTESTSHQATPYSTPTGAASRAAGNSAGTEASFMKQAAAAGIAEVELGQLGSSKATRSEVKDFAQMMVTDHGKANDQLKQLASQKNVALPAEPTAAQKAEKARLEKLSGAAFDSAFMKAMEQDHRKAVSLFSRESRSGSDNDVKQWASETLPKLKEHLSKAEQIAGGRGASSGTKGTTTGQKGASSGSRR